MKTIKQYCNLDAELTFSIAEALRRPEQQCIYCGDLLNSCRKSCYSNPTGFSHKFVPVAQGLTTYCQKQNKKTQNTKCKY